MSTRNDDLGPDPTSQALLRLVPKLGPVVATWRQETHDREQRRVEKLGAAAAEEIGPEQFFRQLAGSERLTDMFNAAVENAVASSSDAKIRLLGKALAAGASAEDEAAVDEAEQLLRVSLELDPVDLRALRALERWTAVDAEHTVAHALRVSSAIAGLIVARLQRLHLIKAERTGSIADKADPDDDEVNIDEAWSVTDTAHALLDLLHQQLDSDDPSAARTDGSVWGGFTQAQAAALEHLADIGPHSWRGEPRPDDSVDRTLRRLSALGLELPAVRDAMRSVGFGSRDLRDLDRWASLR